MTSSPLKVEDSRADFEAWFSSRKESMKRCGLGMIAIRRAHDAAWSAWQASRAAIVVELPDPHAHLIWIQAGHAPDDYWDDVEVSRSEQDKCCDGSDRYAVYAEHEVAEMLAAAGITVKGD